MKDIYDQDDKAFSEIYILYDIMDYIFCMGRDVRFIISNHNGNGCHYFCALDFTEPQIIFSYALPLHRMYIPLS